MEVHWLEQSAADVSADNHWLSVGEMLRFRGMSFPKRRADWRLGRWTTKLAVAAYLRLPGDPETLAAIEIRPDASGAPEIFLDGQPAEVSISLSHRNGTAVCAVAPCDAVLGCDVELVEPRSEAFISDYFTPEEQAIIAQSARPERDWLVTVLWSAKESALKALRTGLRRDTRCVSARLGDNASNAIEGLAEHASLTLACTPPYPADAWSPLRVCYANRQVFQGWWQCIDELAHTMVSIPPANPPILLKPVS